MHHDPDRLPGLADTLLGQLARLDGWLAEVERHIGSPDLAENPRAALVELAVVRAELARLRGRLADSIRGQGRDAGDGH
jgi:hypothetical protein